MRGGALFGKRDGVIRKNPLFGKRDGVIRKIEIQKKLIQSVFYLRNQFPTMSNNPNSLRGMFPQSKYSGSPHITDKHMRFSPPPANASGGYTLI